MSSVAIFLLTILFYLGYSLWLSVRRPKNYPPGPKFLPWVGNVTQLGKEAAAAGGQHKAFELWSQRYNSPILGLKLGARLVVVAQSYEAVRDVNLQEVFEGRPDNFFLRLRTLGKRQGIVCTDGKLWYEHRHFTMKQMRRVGYGRSQMASHIEKETGNLLSYLEDYKSQAMCPGSLLTQSVLNILFSMVAGKGFERGDKRMATLSNLMSRRAKLFDMSGGVLAHLPWLRFVAPEWTGYNLINQVNRELYSLLKGTVDEHAATLTEHNADSDYINAYLWEMQQDASNANDNATFNESQLIATILDFFIAGSHTTSGTMEFVLINLALRQDLQNIIYEEIKANAKHQEFPHLGDKARYPQLEAFIMEVQRLYNILPIIGPRRALRDTHLGGYDIPKNTTVLVGLQSVLMDAKHWQDPEAFRPQRFLDAAGNIVKDEQFMPFGLGRRRCPADVLARSCLFVFAVSILQRFEILPGEGKEDKPSLDLMPGMTLSPKPYKLRFVVRS